MGAKANFWKDKPHPRDQTEQLPLHLLEPEVALNESILETDEGRHVALFGGFGGRRTSSQGRNHAPRGERSRPPDSLVSLTARIA